MNTSPLSIVNGANRLLRVRDWKPVLFVHGSVSDHVSGASGGSCRRNSVVSTPDLSHFGQSRPMLGKVRLPRTPTNSASRFHRRGWTSRVATSYGAGSCSQAQWRPSRFKTLFLHEPFFIQS